MGKLVKEEVEFQLENGKRLITDVIIFGIKNVEVQEVQGDNTGIWVNNDWDLLEGQLSESETKEFYTLLMNYAEDFVEDLSA